MAKKKINLDNLNVDLDIKDNAEELLTVNETNTKYMKDLNINLQTLRREAFVTDFLNDEYRDNVELFNGKKVKVFRHTQDLKVLKIKIYDFETNDLLKEYNLRLDSLIENSTDLNRLEKRANKNGMVQTAIFLDYNVEYFLAENLRIINEYLEKQSIKKVSKKDFQNNILNDYIIRNNFDDKSIFELEEIKENIISKTDKMLDENYKGLSKRVFFSNPVKTKQGLYLNLELYEKLLNVQSFAFPSVTDIKGKRDLINQIYANYLLDFVSNKEIFNSYFMTLDFRGIEETNIELDFEQGFEPKTKEVPVEKYVKKYFSLKKIFDDNHKKPLDLI